MVLIIFMIAHYCAGMQNPYTAGLGTHYFYDRSLLCRDAKPLYSGAWYSLLS
ncbi:hypothetical protein VCRA2119O147_260014 [Vibrio crassostreae]|nr:hypothetical protein VCRA2119O147_260014 [Vibrio crassostreae]CAK3004211.1 hypothetical protein VCRA2121O264_490001 [Vibrio crassostreae]CAK3713239.1 hypothetical protein VCRA2121O262_510001 [Vibrio crassostreae]